MLVADYFENLMNSVASSGLIEDTLAEFEELKDPSDRIKFVEHLYKNQKIVPDFEKLKLKKDLYKSDLYRNEGNSWYEKGNFLNALECYNKRFGI
jgi:hypothetical protein